MNEDQGLRYIERDSLFHHADPICKLFWLLIVAASMFAYRSPLPGLLMLVSLIALTLIVAQIPFTVLLRSSLLIFGVAALLGVFHVLATPGVPLLRVGPFAPSTEGVVKGAGFFLRLSVVVLASFLFIWGTNIRDLMVGLVRLGLSYRFAFAIFMALRFLPLVQQEVDAVRAAHAIRGRGRGRIQHRFRLWQRYMFTVIVNGLRKAESTAIAVESRGFGAFPSRTFVKDFHWTRTGFALVGAYLLLIALLMAAERTGFFGLTG